MRQTHRSLHVILLAWLVIGCASEVRTSATAASTDARPEATTSPSPDAVPTPRVPSPSALPPSGARDFETPIPPNATTGWTGIRWQQLKPDDPIGHIRSITRWSNGFVAVGDPEAADAPVHTPVWTSADGGTWKALGADVFGPGAMVIAMATGGEGLVALTQEGGHRCGDFEACWTLTGPVQAWTSSDGTSWAAHPGPTIRVGDDDVGAFWPLDPLLFGGTPGHDLVVERGGALQAVSHDGVTWEPVPSGAVPKGFGRGDMATLGSRFILVGNAGKKTLSLSSSDGRAWTTSVLQTGTARKELVFDFLIGGSSGIIATGADYTDHGDPGDVGSTSSVGVWWSTLDGDTWTQLPKFPPLGPMRGRAAQECQDKCPDGSLIGDGERMLAYRGEGPQVGWTSFDGRDWEPLAFEGVTASHPGASDRYTISLLPIGVMLRDQEGSTWLGTPIT